MPTTECFASVEMLFICLVQGDGQDSHVGVKYLKCSPCNQLSFHLSPLHSNGVVVCFHAKLRDTKALAPEARRAAFSILTCSFEYGDQAENSTWNNIPLPISVVTLFILKAERIMSLLLVGLCACAGGTGSGTACFSQFPVFQGREEDNIKHLIISRSREAKTGQKILWDTGLVLSQVILATSPVHLHCE